MTYSSVTLDLIVILECNYNTLSIMISFAVCFSIIEYYLKLHIMWSGLPIAAAGFLFPGRGLGTRLPEGSGYLVLQMGKACPDKTNEL